MSETAYDRIGRGYALGIDLKSGAWDERYRGIDKLDVGLRLVVCDFDRRG